MRKLHVRRWLIWGFAVAFTFYEYFLRVSTSVMVPELMREFHVNATALGTLSAFYLYAYAPMQLPVGLLMDRFGARKLLTFASLVCGIGGIIFGFALHIGIAELGRLLIGLGSSFAFVGMIYICTHWFAGKKVALLIGMGNSLGMLGSIFGEGPLSFAVNAYGWRTTSISFGLIGFLIAFIIFILVRNEPSSMQKQVPLEKSPYKLFDNLKKICRNWQTWINGIVSVGIYLTTVGFAALWGTPFLQTAYQISKSEASFASSMIFVGWLFGGPLSGYLSDHLKRRKPLLIIASLLGGLLILPIIYYNAIPLHYVFILLFLLGFVSSVQLLTYSFSIELNPNVKGKGTPVAFTNFLVMLGGSLIQPFIGYLLDLSAGLRESFERIYTTQDYHVALICFPLAFFIAFIFSLFLKETPGHHPKIQEI